MIFKDATERKVIVKRIIVIAILKSLRTIRLEDEMLKFPQLMFDGSGAAFTIKFLPSKFNLLFLQKQGNMHIKSRSNGEVKKK